MRILFAEDEKDLNHIVSLKLKDEGYTVDSCLNGEEAMDYLDITEYDAVILDIMMPVMNGIQVLKAMRDKGMRTPVLFLTARDSIEDRVAGLDAGANDYLVKPFSFDELMARLRVLTRAEHVQEGTILQVGELELDVASHQVRRAGKNIQLSAKEYALLKYLMHHKDRTISREQIEEHVWNYDYEGGTNLVDVTVSHIRKKVDQGFDVPYIHTIRGFGYKISEKK